jgi:2-keto-3-deoxy-L-rhamnonate aldolase RhmA
MIKVDFQNRGYVAQKAVASGFQAVMFTDHRTAEDVYESVRMMKAETPEDGGIFGFPTRRFIGCRTKIPQMDHAKRLRDIVLCFMIEKRAALESIDDICSCRASI